MRIAVGRGLELQHQQEVGVPAGSERNAPDDIALPPLVVIRVVPSVAPLHLVEVKVGDPGLLDKISQQLGHHKWVPKHLVIQGIVVGHASRLPCPACRFAGDARQSVPDFRPIWGCRTPQPAWLPQAWAPCTSQWILQRTAYLPRATPGLKQELAEEAERLRRVGHRIAEQVRYGERSAAERVNGGLKDNHGGRTVRVRGPDKVMCHLMFGVLSFTVLQLVRLVT
jgi:hypothetical protein